MGRAWIGLHLICVFCSSSAVTGLDMVNIALGKAYRQISTYRSQGPSSNAANGNTSGVYSPSNCIHTDISLFPLRPAPDNEYHWWEVDLGRVYPVYNITVWQRTDFKERLYPFTITVDGQQCVRVLESQAPSGDEGSKHVTCSSVMYGQVVRLTLQSYVHMLNLCEFQIFDCVTGYFGLNCSQRCDSRCTDAGCDRNNGHCLACPHGTFGARCNQTCGQCQVNTTCHHETGHCLGGCAAGFMGLSCLQEVDSAGSGEEEDGGTNSLVGPVVGAIVGVGLVMTVSITAAICWRRRSESSRNVGSEHRMDPPQTWRAPDPPPVRQSAVSEDDTYSEVRDPDDNYENPDVTSNYDKLTPYSNDDASRESYMQITTSQADDVKMTSSASHDANTEQSV